MQSRRIRLALDANERAPTYGTTRKYAGRIVSGTTFPNSTKKNGEVFFNLNTLANKSAVEIRFRADASDDSDLVFVDNVVVSAK